MSRYQPGDICWAVVEDIGPVLVTAVGASTPLGDGRWLEAYEGCSFRPDSAPDAIERFALVVGAAAVGPSSSPNADR